jgi:hypothetical protein
VSKNGSVISAGEIFLTVSGRLVKLFRNKNSRNILLEQQEIEIISFKNSLNKITYNIKQKIL